MIERLEKTFGADFILALLVGIKSFTESLQHLRPMIWQFFWLASAEDLMWATYRLTSSRKRISPVLKYDF